MSKIGACRIVAGTLIVLIGLVIGFGGFQLRNGVPASSRDIVAADAVARNTAVAMLAVACVLVIAGLATAANFRWAFPFAALAIVVFVSGGFWANYALFGDVRPIHSG